MSAHTTGTRTDSSGTRRAHDASQNPLLGRMKVDRHRLFLLALASAVVMGTSTARGQEDKSPTVEFLIQRGYTFPDAQKTSIRSDQWPDTIYYNTAYQATLLGSPTIPISFSRLEYRNGAYVVTPTISIGYGYEWFFGHFIFNENDKIIVDPTFFFGAVAEIGLQNDLNLTKPAGFFTGAFVGFSAFSLFFGYDFILQSPAIGLGGRIDLYSIFQNSLKPFGRITEVRKHKKEAPVVEDE